jgi:hypothetical protein
VTLSGEILSNGNLDLANSTGSEPEISHDKEYFEMKAAIFSFILVLGFLVGGASLQAQGIPADTVPKIVYVDHFVPSPNTNIVIQTQFTLRQGPGLHVWLSQGFLEPVSVPSRAEGGWYGFDLFPETSSQLQRFVTRVWSFNNSRVNTTIVVN